MKLDPRVTLHPLIPAVLAVGAVVVLVPFWPALVLAAWMGVLAAPVAVKLTRLTRGRRGPAAVITLALLAAVLAPLAVVIAAVSADAVDFVQRVLKTQEARSVLSALVTREDGEGAFRLRDLLDFVVSRSEQAWALLKVLAGAATKAALDVLVFFVVAYAALVDGKAIAAWLEDHLPIPPPAFRRFAGAFVETGHGLLIGVGGAAAAQGLAAMLAYLVLGVPRALTLGILTAFAAILPAVGTALVWVPVAAGLYLTGRTGAAIALVVIGVALVGSVDNLLRPVLARHAKLDLPASLVLVAMLGGLELVGASGIILGVLVVRLAKEALDISRSHRAEALPAAETAGEAAGDAAGDAAGETNGDTKGEAR